MVLLLSVYNLRGLGIGSTDAALQKLCVRASAWYYYGYSKDKQAFAWLGVRQLCRIKAGA